MQFVLNEVMDVKNFKCIQLLHSNLQIAKCIRDTTEGGCAKTSETGSCRKL